MAISTPPDTLIFKALVCEINEFQPNFSAIDTLDFMCDESRLLAEYCENYFFIDDDGKITEEEAYLLEWLKTMEAQKADELRYKLRETAITLSQNSRY